MVCMPTRQKPLRSAGLGSLLRPPFGPYQYDPGMASSHDIMQKMREVQAGREQAFKPLADIMEQRAELRRQLAETDEPYGAAFAGAEAAGWATEELIAIGAEEPEKRPKSRTRSRRKASKKETPSGASGVSAPEPLAAPPAATIPRQEGAGEATAAAAESTSG